jgi:N-acetylglucosaminyl-diphospho-decaprenol L-rhamnosyltransferase
MEQYATIIISYGRPDLLAALLARVAEQTHPPALVVVVDNSGDLDEAVVDSSPLAAIAQLLRRPDNPGYAAAVNAARPLLADIGIERLLVLTHDADLPPALAAGLLGALESTGAGAAAPLLRRASDPATVFSAGGRLTRNGRAWNTVVAASEDPYEVDWVDGAIVMYSTAALDRIAWLDERYFLYFEDVDTAWRMRRAGWSTVVVPAVVAGQDPGAHPMYLGIRNMVLFAAVAGIPSWRSRLGVVRRVVEESLYRVLHGRRPGLVDAWRGWRDGRHGMTGHPPARGPRG